MLHKTALTLTNPANGNLAFKIHFFESASAFDHIQRNNYYTLIWVKSGSGKLKVDFNDCQVQSNHIYAFSPYQPFMFSSTDMVGIAIHFHPDFFCIHAHHAEVACNGVLFNNIYQPPYVAVDETASATIHMVIDQIAKELQNDELAQYELLISYLKIILITASRLKVQQQAQQQETSMQAKEPIILQTLKNFIESNYKVKHSAGEYAELMNISPKSLAKITKTYFNKTITDLISERIIIEAKRELYLTNKAVKEIAFELGYDDEHYFSRFFKNNADVSPQMYRETVGFDRG
ncbi:MAG: helix-turn-helix domain-containing protein [Bacteroidota bacterium]|nr:helix-turn-helix domain-containing protein [Bacteroidota bacterium]